MEGKENMIKINVTLSPEIIEGFAKLKAKDGMPLSWGLRKAAESYLRGKGYPVNTPNKSK